VNDDRMDEIIREAGEHYHRPPPVPREELWAKIEEERRRHRVLPMKNRRRARWMIWPLAAAALLVIVFSIRYRESERYEPRGAEAPPEAAGDFEREGQPAVTGRTRPAGSGTVARYAAAQLLSRTETVLAQFRMADEKDEEDDRITRWAQDLLLETRLVMNNPATEEPELRGLLGDLELTLARIVQYGSTPAGGKKSPRDRNVIENGMKEKDLLARIRGNIPAGTL
jgi:hypothetical protein